MKRHEGKRQGGGHTGGGNGGQTAATKNLHELSREELLTAIQAKEKASYQDTLNAFNKGFGKAIRYSGLGKLDTLFGFFLDF